MHVVVVDKQGLIMEGIRTLILKMQKYSIEGLQVMPAPTQALRNLSELCVIIDPDNSSSFDTDELKSAHGLNPRTRIIILTNNMSEQLILMCLDANVDGYIQKTCSTEEFIDTFNAVCQGKKSYCQHVLTFLCEQYTHSKHKKDDSNTVALTAQEIKITDLTAWGLTAKEIADKLTISIHTVNTHRKNIFKKIGVKNSSELVMYAVRNGIIDSTEYFI
jgi:DNA-binding NarL/FixJ family response regulator